MNTRRRALFALGLLPLWAFHASAQPERRMRRTGFLGSGDSAAMAPWLSAFRQGMNELQWVEGRDYVMDVRYASGAFQTLHALAAELVATKPDLMLVPADSPIRAVAAATKTIPTVFALANDPVGLGVAASFRQPGGNMTGLVNQTQEVTAKRVQLLKEAFPHIRHVLFLFDSRDPFSAAQLRPVEEAAARLGLKVTRAELREGSDIEPAFKRGVSLGAQAYLSTGGVILNNYRKVTIDLGIRKKLPTVSMSSIPVEEGALMSYSSSAKDGFRRAASYVDKILKGAKPGDLPIAQPVVFELVVNMKTAKAIGVTFPQSILLRADRVIE